MTYTRDEELLKSGLSQTLSQAAHATAGYMNNCRLHAQREGTKKQEDTTVIQENSTDRQSPEDN